MSGVGRDDADPSANPARWLEFLAVLAIGLGIVARFAARPGAPFWLDEAQTGAILAQPSFAAFLRLTYREVSSPLYFLVMRPWADVFGLSNVALRAPSIIFGIATPLVVAFARIPGLTRAERLCWAALIALWIPGVGFAQDARCYALLLLLATLQTLAFVRVMRQPGLRAAVIWVGLSSLTVATHYDAAVLALAQGVIYVAVHRGAALKTWPAALLGIPVVAIIAWQGPEMARYMQPGSTWYKVQRPDMLLSDIWYSFGSVLWLLFLPLFLAVFGFLGSRRRDPSRSAIGAEFGWAAIAALSGVVVLLAAAAMRPIFTFRYLTPFEPGLMLGLILLVRAVAKSERRIAYGCLMVFASAACAFWLSSGALHGDSVVESLNYETASSRLMASDARSVVVAWDNPAARMMRDEDLAAFGGFFFQRAGRSTEIIPVRLGLTDDPNIVLPRIASRSGASILWIYDTWVDGTTASRFPPRFAQLAGAGRCEDLGKANVGIVVCIPTSAQR